MPSVFASAIGQAGLGEVPNCASVSTGLEFALTRVNGAAPAVLLEATGDPPPVFVHVHAAVIGAAEMDADGNDAKPGLLIQARDSFLF